MSLYCSVYFIDYLNGAELLFFPTIPGFELGMFRSFMFNVTIGVGMFKSRFHIFFCLSYLVFFFFVCFLFYCLLLDWFHFVSSVSLLATLQYFVLSEGVLSL